MAIFRKKLVIVKKEENVPDIKVLEKEALKQVVGHNKAVRQITTALYKAKNFKTIRSNILIVGNEVAAKKIVKSVAKSLNIPFIQTKYYAIDNDIVCKLLENAEYNFEVAERGIIIIEEIDKKMDSPLTMENLLGFLESTEITLQMFEGRREAIMPFITKNLILVFIGRFEGVKKIRDRRVNNTSLGFCEKTTNTNQNKRILKQDIADFEIPEEVLDKIDIIIEMNNPSKEQISSRIKTSKVSTFRKYQRELGKKGVALFFDEKIFDLIAESTLSDDQGGKETSNTINYIFENITYDVLANPGKYKKCEMSLDIVKDNTKYKLS